MAHLCLAGIHAAYTRPCHSYAVGRGCDDYLFFSVARHDTRHFWKATITPNREGNSEWRHRNEQPPPVVVPVWPVVPAHRYSHPPTKDEGTGTLSRMQPGATSVTPSHGMSVITTQACRRRFYPVFHRRLVLDHLLIR